ncbi:unnamed protein product [Paramecium sonneborni]|uniref:UBC core domain-containing protein n=1 Tax=Paramecium sonneborni TaxID=65129 RepID=A0A8S1QGB2_9CILI|nr:unnamed protein product [Paramecium sonneborni]
MQNRLNKEFQDLTAVNPLVGVQIDKDPFYSLVWIATIIGPEGTAYKGGKFKLRITFPENYPFKAPHFQFLTKIFHPNIYQNGELCECMLGTYDTWQPVYTVKKVLEKILNLFGQIIIEENHNDQAMNMYQSNKEKFQQYARCETKKYAS